MTQQPGSSSSGGGGGEEIPTVIRELRKALQAGEITEVEFVAGYIAAHVRERERERWLGGCRAPRSLSPEEVSLLQHSCRRGLDHVANGFLRLTPSDQRKLGGSGTRNLVELFFQWQLRKVPLYVNEAITNWALGRRTVRLLFHIPTPLEVLHMQAEGARCLTAFCEEHELARILQDSYPPYEKRDAVKFLIHDLQHLEKFQEELFFCEQVGFCSLISRIENKTPFYADAGYQNDLDHVYSDMNACSVHLLEFFKAKSKLAEQRRLGVPRMGPEEEEQFEERFFGFFQLGLQGEDASQGMEREELRDALRVLCNDGFTPASANYLRTFFHRLGCARLGAELPLIQESEIRMKKDTRPRDMMQ